MRSDAAIGDLYDPCASSVDVLAAMKDQLVRDNPRSKVVLTSRISVGSWRVTAAILREERDLARADDAERVVSEIRTTLNRFGYRADDPERDHRERLFDLTVAIHEDYWSHRQMTRSPSFVIMPFSRLLARLPIGTAIDEVATGTRFVVSSAGTRGIVANGPAGRLAITPPRRDALTSDGELFRIARGREHDPDAHEEYRIVA